MIGRKWVERMRTHRQRRSMRAVSKTPTCRQNRETAALHRSMPVTFPRDHRLAILKVSRATRAVSRAVLTINDLLDI